MNVDDIVIALSECAPEFFSEGDADSYSSLRAVRENNLAPANPDDMRLRRLAAHVRSDDVHMMTEPAGFTREEVNVLADATEMRIVVLRYQRDSERTRECGSSYRQRGCRYKVERRGQVASSRRGKHEPRRDAQRERGTASTTRNPARSRGKTLSIEVRRHARHKFRS